MPEEVFETEQPRPEAGRPLDESKQTNWPKIVLAAVLGFGLLAGATYAGYYYSTQQVQPVKETTLVVSQPTTKPTLTPTPTQTVEDETVGWEIYKSEIYGYRFMYPPTWSLIAPKVGAETTSLSSVREDFDTYPLHDFSVQSYKGVTEQTFTLHKESTRSWVWERGYPTSETRIIDDQDAWTLEGLMKFADDKLYWRIYSLVLYKDSLYELSWWDTPNKLEQQTFDQILSTFKFLD